MRTYTDIVMHCKSNASMFDHVDLKVLNNNLTLKSLKEEAIFYYSVEKGNDGKMRKGEYVL